MTYRERQFAPRWAVSALLLAWVSCVWGVSSAATLKERNIHTSHNARYNRTEIRLDEKVDVRVADQVGTHNYFFIDLYRTQATFEDKFIPVPDGILKGIQTVSYPDRKVLRVIFYPVNKTVFRVADPETQFVFTATPLTAEKLAASSKKTRHLVIDTPKLSHYPFPTLKPEFIPKPGAKGLRAHKRLVILDPGHGGKDPGAMSLQKFRGKRLTEKDLALAVSREVCRLLNKTPHVAARLTRDDDSYMSLIERVNRAEKLDADLFVSVHANSTRYHRSPTARGAEFYYFSTESKNETRALVAAENSADSSKLDPKSNAAWRQIAPEVVKDLLERNRGEGAQACDQMAWFFQKDPYFKNYNRGVRSAPFRVLMNVVSPAVLVEVGFIDNRAEAEKLADPAFQKRIAKLIAQGILAHFGQLDAEYNYLFANR